MSERTLFHGDNGVDVVYPVSNELGDIICSIKDRRKLFGYSVPMMIKTVINKADCDDLRHLLKTFGYNRVFQESSGYVAICF